MQKGALTAYLVTISPRLISIDQMIDLGHTLGGCGGAAATRPEKRVSAAGGGSVCSKLPNRRRLKSPQVAQILSSSNPPPSLLCTLVPCLSCSTHSASS